MKPDPHIRALAELFAGIVLRELKNPRRATSAEGSKSCLTKRSEQRDKYSKSEAGRAKLPG